MSFFPASNPLKPWGAVFLLVGVFLSGGMPRGEGTVPDPTASAEKSTVACSEKAKRDADATKRISDPLPSWLKGTKAVSVTAGWYGPGHHQKVTASGRPFNMYAKTVAHRSLPFGTKVRLITPDGKRSAEGVVNDRGPFIRGRDVDVSYTLAQELGFLRKGVTALYLVRLEE